MSGAFESSAVFDRTGQSTLSRNGFFFLIGCILAWGFLATAFVCHMTASWQPSLALILIAGLGLPILGILMAASDSAFLSFVGYHLIVIPFGVVLGPVLAKYNLAHPGIVMHAASVTGLVTGIMAITGLLFPSFYRSIGGALFVGLIALVIVRIVTLFIPALAGMMLIEYAAALLFALYIGYDMHRASEIPATLDNAVDVSVSLYLDIINLFLTILRILGSKSGD